jgi:hypothetical protein
MVDCCFNAPPVTAYGQLDCDYWAART